MIDKIKILLLKNSLYEALMTVMLGLLTFIQGFLPGAYKPVMDDWFLYGDIYPTIYSRLKYFAIPNEKFAIRPMAGIVDCFVTAPLYKRLWIVELILTISLLIGALLILKTLRRNNTGIGGLFLCILCLFPVNLEATYWIAASTRISCSILFIGAAIYSLDFYYKSGKKRAMILYSILGFFAVSFYEPAIIVYIIITFFVVLSNKRTTHDLVPFVIMCVHITFIVIYYILNSGAGEIESRGGFVTENIWRHAATIYKYIKDIFTLHTRGILENGFPRGMNIILGGHGIIKFSIISIFAIFFGFLSSLCSRNFRFSVKILLLGIILFLSGISLNFVLVSERIPLRLVYFSYIGVGIIIEELIMLLPRIPRYIFIFIAAVALSFYFTASGIGEIRDYQTVSDFDVHITRQLMEIDVENNITNVDKNTYLFGGQHVYEETKCIRYFEHIRGASAAYAELTGCVQHLAGVSFMNNITPFTYGDIQSMKPYLEHQEEVCSFYGLEYDKTVIRVSLSPNGDNYNVLRADGSLFGRLIKVDDTHYQYFD